MKTYNRFWWLAGWFATKNPQASIVHYPVKRHGGFAQPAAMNGVQKLASAVREQVVHVALVKKS